LPPAPRNSERKIRREKTVIVRCTAAEKRRVVRDAEKAGAPLSSYVRARLLDGAGEVREDPSPRPARVQSRDRLVKELSAIGNNLNQIARVANATGEVRRAEQLDELLATLMAKVPDIR